VQGLEEQAAKSNYFIGNNPQKWQTNIANYTKVLYKEVYPGIDVLFYGNGQQLEYDICVAPGKKTQDIRLHLEGVKELSIDESGNLCILTEAEQTLHMQKPFIYQLIEDNKIAVDGQFTLLAKNEIGFDIGTYDTTQSLIIDPILGLQYSTYLGGNQDDEAFGIAVDNNGNAYVTGFASSPNFPTTGGAFQPTFSAKNNGTNAFVTKLNSTLSGLVYSTYLGGSGEDGGNAIAVDTSGRAYVTGFTSSSNFPTKSAYQKTFAKNATDNASVFVTKLNSTGSKLLYSTYLGGSGDDEGNGIALDASSNAYVTGSTSSSNFPTTKGVFQKTLANQTGTNAFVSKINTTQKGKKSLVYSTYLGGSGKDVGNAIAVRPSGRVYVTGFTRSPNFPTTPGAFQTTSTKLVSTHANVFVTKLNSNGSKLLYSTYLGGSGNDEGNGIAVDTVGNGYVTGFTSSSNFPTTPGAFQTTFANNASNNVFITKLNSQGSGLLYSTYLGGSGDDEGNGIAIDLVGNAYVTGFTSSSNFPTTPGTQTTLGGAEYNAFLTKLNAAGSGLLYSTYLGGNNLGNFSDDEANAIAVDASGNAYVTGSASSSNFPTTPGAFQTTLAPGATFNAFVAKFLFAGQTP